MVKADGLAAGKGVVVAQTVAEAEEAVDAMLVHQAFGSAGQLVGSCNEVAAAALT